jgi:hypothetical protein
MVEAPISSPSPACVELFKKAPMKDVFDMFDLEDKLFLRTISKKFCEQVTKTFNEVTVELQDEAEDQKEVEACAAQLKNVHRLTIMNFTINQQNLECIRNLIKNNSNSIHYIHLSFEGEGQNDLVEEYVNIFNEVKLKSFELSIYEDGGSSAFF